ncbi:unnamed protein product, partial [Symbiodinium natans]
ELQTPPATLTPVALAAAATAAQLERRLREARVVSGSNTLASRTASIRRRPHTAGRDRFTRQETRSCNERPQRSSRDDCDSFALRPGRTK